MRTEHCLYEHSVHRALFASTTVYIETVHISTVYTKHCSPEYSLRRPLFAHSTVHPSTLCIDHCLHRALFIHTLFLPSTAPTEQWSTPSVVAPCVAGIFLFSATWWHLIVSRLKLLWVRMTQACDCMCYLLIQKIVRFNTVNFKLQI